MDAQAPWAEPFLACGSHARCTQQAAGVGSQPSCSSTLWALHANPHRAAPVPAVPAVPAVLKVGNSAFADEFNELVPDTWAIINGERTPQAASCSSSTAVPSVPRRTIASGRPSFSWLCRLWGTCQCQVVPGGPLFAL